MLSVEGLHVSYGAIRAVRDVSLEVGEGELVALLGPNGAGKTTTLMSIVGMLRGASGSVRFRGEEIMRKRPEEIVRRGLALAPEGRRVFGHLTVKENLVLAGAVRSDRQQVKTDIEGLFERFPVLGTRAGSHASTLSGGEAQQLAVARALVTAPRLLLLDEPTLGLAPALVDRVFDLIGELREQGLTVLVVDQNAVRAAEAAHRSYVMRTGEVVATGTAEELGGSDGLMRAYLGGARQGPA
jgi:branched-chain amino acid transport system ATP-binding protein